MRGARGAAFVHVESLMETSIHHELPHTGRVVVREAVPGDPLGDVTVTSTVREPSALTVTVVVLKNCNPV